MKLPRQARSACFLVLSCAALGWSASTARAQGAQSSAGGDPVSIQYEAPSSCPDVREFSWRVNARVPRARTPQAGEVARMFIVRVEIIGNVPVGRLTIQEPDSTESSRVLTEEDCRELVDALALMVALAIDPHAALDPAPEPSPPVEPPLPETPPDLRKPMPERKPMRLRFEASLQSVVSALRLPRFRTGAGGISAGVFVVPDRIFSPSARFYRHGSLEYSFEFGEGTASFQWWTLGGEMCPITLFADVLLRPCLVIEINQLQAEGKETRDPEKQTVYWLGLGAASRLTIPLGNWLFVDFSLAFVRASRSDRFELGTQEIHRIPPLDGRTALGVGVRFP